MADHPKAFRAGLIGFGTIGQEVARQLPANGGRLEFVARSDRVTSADPNEVISDTPDQSEAYPDVDVVFLAIPTLDDGTRARRYIEQFTDRGTPVVTCEKGALANYYSELRSRLDRIGLSAAVGGGTRMLHYAKEQMDGRVMEVHVVLNGTLNFIMDGVANGTAMAEMVKESKDKGYAEPQAKSVLEVLNGEAVGDVPKKATILFNYAFETKGIRSSDIKCAPLTKSDLESLERDAVHLRCVVSIKRAGTSATKPALRIFEHEADGWVMCGGFWDIEQDILLKRLVPRGIDNALLVAKEGSSDITQQDALVGPGAGAEATADSMMIDTRELLG